MHNNRSPWHETINGAAERIISIMNDKEKNKVSSIPEGKLQKLRFVLGIYLRNELGLHEGNDADSATDVILETIWSRLNSITTVS